MKQAPRPSKPPSEPSPRSDEPREAGSAARLHLVFGWWSLVVYLALGLALEGMHALKTRFYLDADNETRRLLWTLAHAHGTLTAVLNLVFASTLAALPSWAGVSRAIASRTLLAGSLLMPAGFFLGGIEVYGGDPGLGIIPAPLGALLLILAALITALAVTKRRD